MGEWISSSNSIVTYDYGGVTYGPPTRTVTIPAGHHRQHKGLITTTAVKTLSGWLGQVLADQAIVWESEPQDEREDALAEADAKVADKLAELFAD